MPPFLVPIANVACVQGGTPECTQKAVLQQFSTTPASGGPKTQMHYTNIFRVECLARSHPLVNKVEKHKISKLSDAKKAELRQVVRKAEKQQHICDQRESWQQNPFAASGANMPQRDEKHARDMEDALDSYCEPIPAAQEFLTGIRHWNDDRAKRRAVVGRCARACLQKGALQGAAA